MARSYGTEHQVVFMLSFCFHDRRVSQFEINVTTEGSRCGASLQMPGHPVALAP